MNNIWYLSPSRQKANIGINDYGNESQRMYQLTDRITPHLDRCGVSFVVADQEKTLAQRVAESNAMGTGYHLALHSNAGGGGTAWGPVAYYYSAGKTLAETLIAALLGTGQKNNRSQNTVKNTSLYELRKAAAPACLLEVDFHDSEVGVEFLLGRMDDAAEAIAKAIVAVDGKKWVEVSTTAEEAAGLGLFEADASGDYRWDDGLTRAEAAYALMKLKKILGGEAV